MLTVFVMGLYKNPKGSTQQKPLCTKAVKLTNKSCLYEQMYLKLPFLLQHEMLSYTMTY